MIKTATLRSFPAQVWIVSLATFLNRSVGFLALFAAVFFKSLDLNASNISLALFAVGAAGVVGAIVGGWFAARFGPISVLVAGSILNIPLLLILGFSYDNAFVPIVAAALSVGLSQSFVGPSAVLITESNYQGETVTVFAFYRIFINVGSVVAPAIAGIFGLANFRLLFILSAVGSAAAAILLIVSLPILTGRKAPKQGADAAGAEGTEAEQPEKKGPTEFFSTFRRARLWCVVVVFGLTVVIYTQHQSGIPLSVERLSQGDRLFALLLFINPIIIIFCELPLSFLVAKIRWNLALGIGVALTAVGLAITGLGGNWAICIAGFVVFSIGEAVFAPLANSSIANMTYSGENARYQGYLSAAQSLGISVGPGAGAFGVLNNRSLFWVMIVILGLVLGVAAVLAGQRKKVVAHVG
jgi:MFS family permease